MFNITPVSTKGTTENHFDTPAMPTVALRAAIGDLLPRDRDFATSLCDAAIRGPLTDKQRHWVNIMLERAQAAKAAPKAAPAVTRLPNLFDLMQRLAKLEIGFLTIARKNQSDLCWIKAEGVEGVIGKLDGGVLSLFARCADRAAVTAALLEIERDPKAAAVLHGKASGRCSVCSRDLTDPESIARGVGPICAGKF